MEWITLNTIPTWVPGIVMIYTAIIWLITRKLSIRMDTRIIAFTLLWWGILYLLASFSPEQYETDNLVARVFMSRLIICFICISQSLPMTISWLRGKKREEIIHGK
jgi:hypothetical protein